MIGGALSRRGLWLDPRTKILLLLLCILSAMMAPSLFYELGLVVLIGLLGICFPQSLPQSNFPYGIGVELMRDMEVGEWPRC